MEKRVVITGLGVVSPTGIGLEDFRSALKQGRSGIKFDQQLADLQFSCQVSGTPIINKDNLSDYFTELELRNFNSTGILYGVIAGLDAWKDAGLEPAQDDPAWENGTVFGAGTSGIEKFRESIYKIDALQTRKLGSTAVSQTMNSGISAYLGGKLGFGNQVTTNSSACTTGTESILMAFDRIKSGKAKRMLVGSTSDSGPYIWAGFDAIKVCNFKSNDHPEAASRPMSASASGFVPGSGAGALVIEELESALDRNAKIYCEILGGNLNSGGQRGGGSMTAPNSAAVQRCIKDALTEAKISAGEIDYISGHLTATTKDATEIRNLAEALNRFGKEFPYINSLKASTGHCLSAAASLESVAAVLQLSETFVAPNINCEDLHSEIVEIIDAECVPQKLLKTNINTAMKVSFGFGDVNGCIIFRKFKN